MGARVGASMARVCGVMALVAVGALLGCGGGGSGHSTEVAFVGEPTIGPGPNPNAPLVHVVTVDTNVPTRVELRIAANVQVNGTMGVREPPEIATHHEIPILGLLPDLSYEIGVVAIASDGAQVMSDALDVPAFTFPDDFPRIDVHRGVGGGFTLIGARNKNQQAAYIIILDGQGRVVWFLKTDTSSVVTPLANGHLVTILANRTIIEEIDLLGQTVHTWYAARSNTTPPPANGIPVDAFTFHNDVFESADHTLLVPVDVVRFVDDFPTDENDPSVRATAPVLDEPILEFGADDGATVRTWNFLDLLKPTRIGFDATIGLPANADWAHTNAVIIDPRDDSIIASLRHQDAVVKASRVDGTLRWILGPHENWEGFERYLLTPVGEGFAFSYHQHAPQLTSRGTLLVFDNGNWKASPFTGQPKVPGAMNHSRAVEYAIDESALTVQQVWEFVAMEQLFSPFVGSAYELAGGNVLITYGGLCTVNGVPSDDIAHCRGTARILEVARTQGNQVVLDVEVSDPDPSAIGWFVYRSYRLARLE